MLCMFCTFCTFCMSAEALGAVDRLTPCSTAACSLAPSSFRRVQLFFPAFDFFPSIQLFSQPYLPSSPTKSCPLSLQWDFLSFGAGNVATWVTTLYFPSSSKSSSMSSMIVMIVIIIVLIITRENWPPATWVSRRSDSSHFTLQLEGTVTSEQQQ